MSDNPLVSICIPSYNHAPFLSAALESALSQTYSNIEIIVVDDGSTDDSLAIAESYAARYPTRLKVYTHPGRRNLGISATANLALLKASGEYYSVLASDDVLYTDKIERQVRYLEKHPSVGWVYGYADLIDKTGKKLPDRARFRVDITHDPNPLERLIERNVIPSTAVLSRRRCVDRIGHHDETLTYSDWDFWVRLLAHFEVGYLDRPVVMFRLHDYNTSSVGELKTNVSRGLEVMRKLRRDASLIGGGLANLRTQALLDLQIAYHLFFLEDEAEAAHSLQAAFETDPALKTDEDYFASWLTSLKVYDPLDRQRGYDFKLWILSQLPENFAARIRKRCAKRLATEEIFYQTDSQATRWMAVNRLFSDPGLLRNRDLRLLLSEKLVGARLTRRLRNFKRTVA